MNRNYALIIQDILFILFALLAINMRPGIIGQSVGLNYYLFTLVITLILFLKSFNRQNLNKAIYINFIIIIILYIEINSIFLGTDNIKSTLGLLFTLLISINLYLCLDEDRWHMAFNLVLWIVIFFTTSHLITIGIIIIVKNIQLLKIAEFQINMGTNNNYDFVLLFPFSVTYSKYLYLTKLPRFTGFVREPGIYQIFVLISFYYQKSFRNRNYFIEIILFVALLMTFSSTGYILFFLTYPIYLIINHNKKILSLHTTIIFTILTPLLYIFIYSNKKVGFLKKLSTKSGQVRLESIKVALNTISEWLYFGNGLYSTSTKVDGVSMLSILPQIGIIGLIIISLPFIYICYKTLKIRSVLFIFTIIIYITLFFAQPIFDKALTYYFLSLIFYGYNTEKYKEENRFRKISH